MAELLQSTQKSYSAAANILSGRPGPEERQEEEGEEEANFKLSRGETEEKDGR